MSSSPTHSQLDRLDESLHTQIHRFEAKIDNLATAVARLMVFEERQANFQLRLAELTSAQNYDREVTGKRAQLMGERFDQRITAVEVKHEALRLEVHGRVQRWAGITAAASVAAGGLWSLALKFV